MTVNVPDTVSPLNEAQLAYFLNLANSQSPCDDLGVSLFTLCKRVVHNMLT